MLFNIVAISYTTIVSSIVLYSIGNNGKSISDSSIKEALIFIN